MISEIVSDVPLGEWMRNSVLWYTCPHNLHHSAILFRFSFVFAIHVSREGEEFLTVRSSAYEKGEGIFIVMSVMKKMNNNADSTLPWGTPISISIQSDMSLFAMLLAILSDRNEATLNSNLIHVRCTDHMLCQGVPYGYRSLGE